MSKRRGWRHPKQDHSVYVQQLFKDFLARNTVNSIANPSIETRKNFSRAESKISENCKQRGIFDRAVYARFERNTNCGGFIRQEPTRRSKTGLMRWIDQQCSKHEQRAVIQKTSRKDDYLNLPGNFFSGTEQMKLPFDMADRTLGNVTNNFIPPATSTPFDRLTSFGVSGVLSDPDEFQTNQPNQKKSACFKSTIWDTFLKSCVEHFNTIAKEHGCQSALNLQRDEMETLLRKTGSNPPLHQLFKLEMQKEPHPTTPGKKKSDVTPIVSKNHQLTNKKKYPPIIAHSRPISVVPPKTTHNQTCVTVDDLMLETDSTAIDQNIPNNFPFFMETCSQKLPHVDATQDDLLLVSNLLFSCFVLSFVTYIYRLQTASPPSPIRFARHEHPRCLYDESTFLVDLIARDDFLTEKLDGLLKDEDFNIDGISTDRRFDFGTPSNETIMNNTFPNHFQTINYLESNENFAGIPVYLSQDILAATTIQDSQEAMF